MATKRNPYYADPALAQAFNNLAGMFAPPSGADAAGFATASAKRAEADRQAQLFANPNDPDAASRAALLGYQTYGNTRPGFMQSDATTRRAQDVSAQTTLTTNARDNQRAMAVQAVSPLSEGQVRPAAQSVADMYSIPEFGQSVTGAMKLAQGQDAVLASGQRVEGPRKPLSSDELTARIMDQQMASGAVTPQAIMGPKLGTPQAVQTPQGPRLTTPGEAMLSGATPYNAPSNGSRKDGMALLPDGRRVPVTRAPDGLQWQAQDGAPVPPDAQVFDMAKPQGTNEQLGITSSNVTEANRIKASLDASEFTVRNMRDILQKNPNVAGIPGRVKGMVQSLSSSAGQVAKAYASEAPNASLSLNDAKSMLDRVAGGYDPDIVRLQSGIMDLAYARAQIGNPSGEVSRQAFERALESFGQSYLSSQQDMETGLAAFERDTIAAGRVKEGSLRGARTPGASVPQAPQQQAAPQVSAPASPPGPAVEMLRANPTLIDAFDAKYGAGSAARVLGGR